MTESAEALRSRWRATEGQQKALEILDVLARGADSKILMSLGVGETDGRIDLRGLTLPESKGVGTRSRERRGIELRGLRIQSVDLTGALLPDTCVFDSSFDDVALDGALLTGLRVWRTGFRSTSFRAAKMRDSAVGAWTEGGGNRFEDVDFSDADLSGAAIPAATFIGCDFSHARIGGIDFQSSSFVRCRFAGELRDVTFWDRGFGLGKPDANPMKDVDFSDASLLWVDFRRLDLEAVRWPRSREHLVLQKYPCVLERALARIEGDDSVGARVFRALLLHRIKWRGPQQSTGVWHMGELGESPRDRQRAVEVLLECERDCLELEG